MTKKLEDLLNMDDSKEIIKQAEQQEKEQTKHEIAHQESFRDIAEFDKIASLIKLLVHYLLSKVWAIKQTVS